ncbi:MAG: substrate-binding domain-containing protein [Synechococcaceae cyanobacterium SM1_2_3]|nr:substrate-binding domain-containing protein [Synechococcaceae cyanobacterium SM1_2_3]
MHLVAGDPRQRHGEQDAEGDDAQHLAVVRGGCDHVFRQHRAEYTEEIPHLALAGFDDLPWTRLVEPGITVIAQPTYDLGRATIELLLQRINHPAQSVRRVVLRGELRERGSSLRRSA